MNLAQMTVLSTISHAHQQHTPLLVALLDPDKQMVYPSLLPYLKDVDMVFVGGSTGRSADACVAQLRAHTDAPIVLFPGNIDQLCLSADAILYLSLLNSRKAEFLIEPHIRTALPLLQSGIELISMGYILLDGGRRSAVEIVSNCQPLACSDIEAIRSHAAAGQLLGKQLIYLEAGSGARTPIPAQVIQAVRGTIDVPLIVGGGISSVEQMLSAFQAGADIVVIGNYFEQNPQQLPLFIQAKNDYANR